MPPVATSYICVSGVQVSKFAIPIARREVSRNYTYTGVESPRWATRAGASRCACLHAGERGAEPDARPPGGEPRVGLREYRLPPMLSTTVALDDTTDGMEMSIPAAVGRFALVDARSDDPVTGPDRKNSTRNEEDSAQPYWHSELPHSDLSLALSAARPRPAELGVVLTKCRPAAWLRRATASRARSSLTDSASRLSAWSPSLSASSSAASDSWSTLRDSSSALRYSRSGDKDSSSGDCDSSLDDLDSRSDHRDCRSDDLDCSTGRRPEVAPK